MHLIEILLPLNDNAGAAFPESYYTEIQKTLAKLFGGVTAFTRSPAEGRWKETGKIIHDDIVIFQVEVENIDKSWWKTFRQGLEKQFRQDKINIRAYEIAML